MVYAIDYDACLAAFDDLVARDAIYFSPPTTEQHQNGGFPVRENTPKFEISQHLLI